MTPEEQAEQQKENWLAGETCNGCLLGKRLPLHVCPYKLEIRGDRNSLCDCCESCTQRCRLEV